MDAFALIPILSVVGAFSVPVIIVAIVMYIHYKKEVMRNRERMAAIEKGIDLPDLSNSSHHREHYRSYNSSLRGGIVLLFVGIGLTLALWVNAGMNGAVWGVFIGLIGVGKLVYWAIAGRRVEKIDLHDNAGGGKPME